MRTAAALVLAFTLSASAQARTYTLRVNDSVRITVFGATSAYAVDSAIVDASAQGSALTLRGRSAGRTQVILVTLTGQTAFDVTVEAQKTKVAPPRPTGVDGRVETRYTSAGRQIHNTIDVTRENAKRRTQLHVENVRYGSELGMRAETTMPSVSYRVFTRNREMTFLDRIVDHSPLTLSSTTVRGFHYLDDTWRVHAGTTAYASYQSFLLPADHLKVFGAAYTKRLDGSTRITPALFVVGAEGTIASLLVDHARASLNARAELGVSNGLGGAVQFKFDGARDRVYLDVRYRPRDFVSVNAGEPRGFFADGTWSRTFAGGSTIDAAVSANDFDLPGFDERSLTATANGRLHVSDRLSLLGGATYGSFHATHSLTIPIGAHLDLERFGATAIARWTESAATNRGGLGFRVSARASAGRLFGTAYLDHQKQAPTLALIFREQPDLALALAQLGITATTPADIARALRENSTLIELGYIEGVTVDLAPARTQAGFEIAWLGAGASHPQLRARVLLNRNESVATQTDTIIATLTASRRMTASTDLFASYTYWSTQRRGQEAIVQPIVEVGMRHRFDTLPTFNGAITGVVYRDENLDGVPEGGIAGAEIELDGARATTTANDGTFAFKGVAAGAHRVIARVPQKPEAFFTTPSRVEASPGDAVRFGVAMTPARVFGRIVSDAGVGLGDVAVTLTQATTQLRATSSSDGTFTFAAAPGAWQLDVDPGTLAAGYTMTATTQAVHLDRAAPRNVSFAVNASRSISGIAPSGVRSIEVSDGRRVPVDAEGKFSIRSLPAGEITLRAGARVKRVTLSREPVVVRDVTFETR